MDNIINTLYKIKANKPVRLRSKKGLKEVYFYLEDNIKEFNKLGIRSKDFNKEYEVIESILNNEKLYIKFIGHIPHHVIR